MVIYMEYIKKCNICGKIWCYTDEDINDNTRKTAAAAISSIGAIANAIGGNRYDSYEQNKMAAMASNKIYDFDKCPNCNSRDFELFNKEEYIKYRKFDEKKNSGFFLNTDIQLLMAQIQNYIIEKEWFLASLYLEQIIEDNPDIAELYLMKIYVVNQCTDEKELIECCLKNDIKLQESINYINIIKCDNKEVNDKIHFIIEEINTSIEKNKEKEKENLYNNSVNVIHNSNNIIELKKAQNILIELGDYKDSNNEIEIVNKKIDNRIFEEEKIKKDKAAKEKKELEIKLKRYKKIILLICVASIVILVGRIVLINFVFPYFKYEKANKEMENENYEIAIDLYNDLNDYKNAKEKQKETTYEYATKLLEKNPMKAYELFETLDTYGESLQNKYIAAINAAQYCEQKKEIRNAYEWYLKGNEKDKALEILYTYVINNKDNQKQEIYDFIKILLENQYKDSENIYKELYSKNLEIVISESKENRNPITKIEYGKSYYLHFKISGLYPNEEFKINIKSVKIDKDTGEEWGESSEGIIIARLEGEWDCANITTWNTSAKSVYFNLYNANTQELLFKTNEISFIE